MNQKEKMLFLNLCAFMSPNRERIERLITEGAATPELLGYLFANRMAGIAYGSLEKTSTLDNVNREFRTSLKNAKIINEKINDDFFGCVKYITAELDQCDVPYALLKGAFLCQWYPKGYRTSNDIDVLVSPEDIGRVSAKLKLGGFKQGYLKNGTFVPATRQQIIESRLMRGETVPFVKETRLPYMKYIEVDLNFSLDYKNSDESILKKMLSRTKTVGIDSNRIRTLSDMDFLLHLCAHLYKEATTLPWIHMKRDMTFYKYCDIYALLYDLSCEEIDFLVKEAVLVGLEREVSYCINSIKSFFGESAIKYNQYILTRKNDDLDFIVDPQQKKKYRYKETDPVNRFFCKDRIKLLMEDI